MPDWKREIKARLAKLRLEPTREAAIIEELTQHLDDCYRELLAAGATEAEAERQALSELSSKEIFEQELGRVERQAAPAPIVLGNNRRGNMIADLGQDLRFGARLLLKKPGFALVAILTLALGVGANTAIFTVVNALLLRPLPYPEAERLVTVMSTMRRERIEVRSTSYPDFLDWRSQNSVFEQIAAHGSASLTLLGGNEPERISGELISANYFSLLGLRPIHGRDFLPEEDLTPGGARVAILGYDLWQRRFGGDPGIIGQTIRLSDGSYTVVGIMPEGFRGVEGGDEMWLPMMMISAARNPASLQERNSRWHSAIARLKPGVSLAQAQSEMDEIARGLERAHPDSNTNRGAIVTPLHEDLFGDFKPMLWTLFAAVGCVLLVTCANVASLLLERAATRQKETAIRLALGATRRRLLRQLLTESLILALAGGALGIVIASWSVDLLLALNPAAFPRFVQLTLDPQVLGFNLLVSLVTSLLFGLAPALQAASPALNEALKDGGRNCSGGLGRNRLLGAMVVSEIAIALVLLIGAGLMIRSLQFMQAVDPGFRSERLLTMRFNLPMQKYQDEQREVFIEQLGERIKALPGVQGVSLSSDLPLGGSTSAGPVILEGQTVVPADTEIRMYRHSVTPQFFSTLGIALVRGRDFNAGDHREAASVAIVSEALARRFWPGEDPIGKRLKEVGARDFPWRTIVGVVAEVKYRGLPQNPNPDPDIYMPLSQRPNNNLSLAVRTEADPAALTAAVRGELQKLDADLPVYSVTTMAEAVARQTTRSRFSTWLLGIFGGLALLLAAVGIYSVVAYAVEQRTQEIGIRLALGARPANVLKMVIGQGLRLAMAGVAIGAGAALVLTQMMKRMLYGVAAADPLTFGLTALLLTAVATAACYLPARRATRVDPIAALRSE